MAPIIRLISFQFKRDLDSFNTFAKYVELFYVDNQPRHISSPSTSSFAFISHKKFKEKSSHDVQSLMRTKHLVVTGMPSRDIGFDEKGLKTLTNLQAKISIQGKPTLIYRNLMVIFVSTDQSINAADGYFTKQVVIGTLQQLLEASRSESGPILNALSFPLPLSGVQATSTNSEVEAWRSTQGEKFCPPEVQFPVGDIRWGLAATNGARHWIHIDSDGFGTYIDVQCGGKWWITFNPPANKDKYAFASIYQFLDNFDTNAEKGSSWELATSGGKDTKENEGWIAEAVYLEPGTRL